MSQTVNLSVDKQPVILNPTETKAKSKLKSVLDNKVTRIAWNILSGTFCIVKNVIWNPKTTVKAVKHGNFKVIWAWDQKNVLKGIAIEAKTKELSKACEDQCTVYNTLMEKIKEITDLFNEQKSILFNIDSVKTNKKEAEAKIKAANEEINKLNLALEMTENTKKENEMLKNQSQQHKEKINDLSTLIDNTSQEISSKKSEIDNLYLKKEVLVKNCSNAQDELKKAQELLSNLEKTETEKNEENIQKAKIDLAEKEKIANDATTELGNLEMIITNLVQTTQILEQGLQDQIKEQESLKEDLEKLTTSIILSNEKLEKAQKEEEITQEIEKHKKNIESQNKLLEQYDSDLDNKTTNIENLNQKIELEKSKLESIQEIKSETEFKIDTLNQEINQLRTEIK